ncbi:MAG: hypothetical protein IJ083_06725 [Clostridia bacterium]|nr:hypothetical protein [Clostridia bacterium]
MSQYDPWASQQGTWGTQGSGTQQGMWPQAPQSAPAPSGFQPPYQGTGVQGTQPPFQDPSAQPAAQPAPEASAVPYTSQEGGFSQPIFTPPPEQPKPRRHLSPSQWVIVFFFLALFGVYIYLNYSPQRALYGKIQIGSLGTNYTGDALIVRNEVPFDADGVTSIEYIAEEGKSIARNITICNVYSSGFSTRETAALQEYRDQIRDYELGLVTSETTYDAQLDRVNTDVLTRAREVREIIAGTRGSLPNQEKLLGAAVTARQQYLHQKYAGDQRLTRLLDDEQAQKQRIDSWTKQYVSNRECIVSFYSDGFEYGLTAQNYDTFSPAEVRRMIQGNKPENSSPGKSKTTIYRTVFDGQFVVLMLVDQATMNPVEGQKLELQLERLENTKVEAVVDSFTRSGNELLLRLKVESSVLPVLYMRSCKARLGDYVSTFMVPTRAIYHQDNMDGVVVQDGSNSLFIPVKIERTEGNQTYITPLTDGLLFENQTIRLF